ncbi:hypothetical protein EI94DRAFT_1623117 [Lactarius quietus]|nr:hypothetical protein EI94DRAFT_1623117 [Lactarius quietus]
MWADFSNAAFCHFYVRELAQMRDRSFVIPVHWVTIQGVPSFAGYQVLQGISEIFNTLTYYNIPLTISTAH